MSMKHGKIIPLSLRIQTREPWHASRPSLLRAVLEALLKLLQAKRMGAKRPLEEASPQLKMLESQLKIP
ncbi:hypothetical protein WN943_026611 [Citrus x changshan-huyou]